MTGLRVRVAAGMSKMVAIPPEAQNHRVFAVLSNRSKGEPLKSVNDADRLRALSGFRTVIAARGISVAGKRPS